MSLNVLPVAEMLASCSLQQLPRAVQHWHCIVGNAAYVNANQAANRETGPASGVEIYTTPMSLIRADIPGFAQICQRSTVQHQIRGQAAGLPFRASRQVTRTATTPIYTSLKERSAGNIVFVPPRLETDYPKFAGVIIVEGGSDCAAVQQAVQAPVSICQQLSCTVSALPAK